MAPSPLEPCPGCKALLPPQTGAEHRYIGASSACWTLFANLSSGAEPPLAPEPLFPLLRDAYAAQHPGTPSPQSIQSVGVHLLTLYGVLEGGVTDPMWIRMRAVRGDAAERHRRFRWLTPPNFEGCLAVVDIVRGETPPARAQLLRRYVHEVWARWAHRERATVVKWYGEYIGSE